MSKSPARACSPNGNARLGFTQGTKATLRIRPSIAVDMVHCTGRQSFGGKILCSDMCYWVITHGRCQVCWLVGGHRLAKSFGNCIVHHKASVKHFARICSAIVAADHRRCLKSAFSAGASYGKLGEITVCMVADCSIV